MCSQRCNRLPSMTGALGPASKRLGVNCHQRTDERTGVAHHDGLTDQRVHSKPVLKRSWRNVLATGSDDQFLCPASDVHEAAIINSSKIPGAEPAITVNGLGSRCLIVPVAAEDLGPFRQDLVLVSDLKQRVLHRRTNGSWAPSINLVHRQNRARLGQPVALVDPNPHTVEERRQPLTKRSATAERQAKLASKLCRILS